MTAKTCNGWKRHRQEQLQRQQQKQIPYGDDNQRDNDNGKKQIIAHRPKK
jgi:hypothetical protein